MTRIVIIAGGFLGSVDIDGDAEQGLIGTLSAPKRPSIKAGEVDILKKVAL
jgi:hypothetical protein